jgi:alkanesulfonate monooxygenase
MAKLTPVFHRAGIPHAFDGRSTLGQASGERRVDFDYQSEVARAAERNGFDSILCITTSRNHDAWIASSALAAVTKTLKFIVAVRPGLALPTLVAQQAATFQALSNDRLYMNIVTGSHEAELRGYGDQLDKAGRYARTGEFFDILDLAWKGAPFEYRGQHYVVTDGGLPAPVRVRPKLFIGGSSDNGRATGARYADIHLSYGEPPPMVREHVERVSELADKEGRKVEFGILIPVIARRTAEEAWAETDRLLDALDPAVIAKQQRHIRSRNSVSQARVQSLNAGRKDREALKVYPNIWAGSGLVGGGGGSTSLVGSYEQVAERIDEYLSVGVRHFIISGRPALESIYEFGEEIIPFFKRDRREAVDNHGPAASAT